MSSFAVFEQAVSSVLALRGVKRCIVVTSEQDSLQARKEKEELSRTILMSARDVARRLLEDSRERGAERILEHVIVARRFDDVAVAVIGDASLDENEVHRKLNVMAIRLQVRASKEGPGPLALALREAYVAVAGPLSAMVFDRAFEALKRTRRTIDTASLRVFAESLADSLTPPTNHRLRERFQQAMSTWETPSDSFEAAARVAPARAPLARPTTVPRMAAVQQVVRDMVGPLGDLLVQRAIESNIATDPNSRAAAVTQKLINTIAAQLPAQHRERFMVEGRAAIGAAIELAAPPTAAVVTSAPSERRLSAAKSAIDDQGPQR